MEWEINAQTSTKKAGMTAPVLADGLCVADNGGTDPLSCKSGLAAMINRGTQSVCFADNDHLEFYTEQTKRLNPDCYQKALIYTLGISPDTRCHFESLYDAKSRSIVPEAIQFAWQTSGSLKVTRLAFQLFTDCATSAFIDPGNPDFNECARHSVSDIFCCGYAPYFVEAIKLRYPEYMGREWRKDGEYAGR